MGTQITDIVDVTITRETARVTQQGFGTPLLLSEHAAWAGRVKTYTDPADMLTDGFISTDAAYKMAIKLMSQEVSPDQFKIGRKILAVNAKQRITLSDIPDAGSFTITVGTYTTAAIAYGANNAAIKAAIELLSNVTEVTVSGSGTVHIDIEFTGVDGNKPWATMSATSSLTKSGSPVTTTVSVLQTGVTGETMTAALNAVIATDNDFYMLLLGSRVKQDILDCAAIIETKSKMFCACGNEAATITSATTDTATALKTAAYKRSFIIYSDYDTTYPDCAWVGGVLPKDPGSATWKFKQLSGPTPSVLDATALVNLKAKYCNYFETIAGLNMVTSDAICSDNGYIDIQQGIDYIAARMSEKVFTTLGNADKVPFTSQGMSLMQADVDAILKDAADIGIIDRTTIVINPGTPLASDKANRLYKTLKWSATLQGAVHSVQINGKVVI